MPPRTSPFLPFALYLVLFAGQSLLWPRPQTKAYAEPLLDEVFWFSTPQAQQFLTDLGEAGRSMFITTQLIDLAIAAVGCYAAWRLSCWAADRRHLRGRAVRLFAPLLLATFEIADDGGLIAITIAGPGGPPWLFTLSSLFTSAKFILTAIFVLTVLVLTVLGLTATALPRRSK